MPELAEVEFFRKRWSPGLGQVLRAVDLRAGAKVFRGTEPRALQALVGTTFESSAAAAKQMLFRFSGGHRLGVHLGMTGALRAGAANEPIGRHDHLCLTLEKTRLFFCDPRMFGRIQFSTTEDGGDPIWWTSLPPSLLSPEFSVAVLAEYLGRHARAPLKALLLDQGRFPGIGNWMADEILWRAKLHPAQPGGSLGPKTQKTLWREIRWVCQHALEIIGEGTGPELPDPPATWLFPHRWNDGGQCPRTRQPLQRETIGGRTTCLSPARQGEKPLKRHD